MRILNVAASGDASKRVHTIDSGVPAWTAAAGRSHGRRRVELRDGGREGPSLASLSTLSGSTGASSLPPSRARSLASQCSLVVDVGGRLARLRLLLRHVRREEPARLLHGAGEEPHIWKRCESVADPAAPSESNTIDQRAAPRSDTTRSCTRCWRKNVERSARRSARQQQQNKLASAAADLAAGKRNRYFQSDSDDDTSRRRRKKKKTHQDHDPHNDLRFTSRIEGNTDPPAATIDRPQFDCLIRLAQEEAFEARQSALHSSSEGCMSRSDQRKEDKQNPTT